MGEWIVPEVCPTGNTSVRSAPEIARSSRKPDSKLTSGIVLLFLLAALAGAAYMMYLGITQPWLEHRRHALLLMSGLNTPCYRLPHNPGWYAC